MFALSFQFPARRYHATPWGRAVNEAEVAWPPEPWRLLRALIAAHWRKGDRSDESAENLQQLVHGLAETLPVYQLPTGGIHAHTRHYMPIGVLDKSTGRDKTALVFDAFARLPEGIPLVVAWPDVTLDPQLFRYATDLATSIGYLGRAESWTECTALADWEGAPNCVPLESPAARAKPSSGRPIRLLAPLSATDYGEQRRQLVAGLKPKSKVLQTLPELLVDALTLETADYQAQGWNRPPASREAIYSMEAEAALGVKSRKTSPRLPRRQEQPTVARFLVAGRPLPRVEDSIKIGELMRMAALSKFGWEKGRPKAPWQVSGRDRDGKPLKDPHHAHAFWLPEDADGDGWIDHISVFIDGGIDATVREGLDRITRLWIPGTQGAGDSGPEVAVADEWRLALEGFGHPADFAGSAPIFKTSARWRSTTPFLAAGHLKPAGHPKEARRLLRMRGRYLDGTEINKLEKISIHGTERRPVHFHRFRSRGGERQRDAGGAFLTIAFPRPVEGPLAIGYGSHFGLGLFVPDDRGDDEQD